MVDNRLFPAPVPARRFMRREHLEWLSSGENEEYFADEIITLAQDEVRAFTQAAEACFQAMCATAKRLAQRGDFEALGIPSNAQQLISHSVAKEFDDFLIGRFDFAGGLGDYPIKMLEFNADTCSLIPETAHVQRHLWVEMRKKQGNGPFDPLLVGLTQQLKQVLADHPDREPTLLLSSLGYEEDQLNIMVIAEAARAAGFKVVQEADLEAVIFDPENGLFLETGRDQFQHFAFWYKMIPWEFFANEEPELMALLSEMIINNQLKVLNPAWTMLLQSKGLLAHLAQDHPELPSVLRASFSSSDFPDGRYARKPLFGRTGQNVAIYDGDTTPLDENTGDYGNQPFIYQALANFDVDEEGYRYQASIFHTSRATALGIRRQDDVILDDDAEFVGHTVV